MNGFRLDRRRDALRGGTIAVIAPGNSAGSRLYQRLIGSQYGPQMPLTGPLSAQEIEIFKKWIDQGAPWPDALSGEMPLPLPDAQATLMMNALRGGDAAGFRKALNDNPTAVNNKGFGGSTPLMYAVLYSDAATVKLLLDKGADPNIRNNAGATALMWVGVDVEKARLLIDKGADVNAKSDDARTPLLVASNLFGSTPLMKLLLDHKASPSVVAPSLFGPFTPITGATKTANEASLKMLLDSGADLKAAGFLPQIFGMLGPCAKCAEMVKAPLDPQMATIATTILGPPAMDARHITAFLDQGVDVNSKDPDGHTLLMLAANSDALPVETVKALLDRGAELNAKTSTGQTALDFAALRGNTPVTDLLTKAGGTRTVLRETPKMPQPAANARAAVQRSLPLLQRTDSVFIQKSGCVSCHNNTLAAVTISTARKNGFTVNETIAAQQKKIISNYVEGWRDRLIQGMGIPGNSDTVSYILMGMGAENIPADPATDAMALFIKNEQLPNGQWNVLAHRPPIESNNIEVTAASLKSLQLYAPKTQRAEYDAAIRRAVDWLKQQKPISNEERVFQLLGLRWGGVAATDDVVRTAAQNLIATQHSNGGWSQLTSMVSDAYATGQALVALQEAGIATTDAAVKKGIQYLLSSQLEDGSWYVKTRAFRIQPYFDAGFPHGRDQFISAAATNWAVTALAASAGTR
jgi:ankyrin repeat protein